MIARFIAVVALLLCGGASAGHANTMTSGAVTTIPAPSATATGWRFGGGNICVQDQTGGRLSDGLWRASLAWSKAADINLLWRRSCTGFTQAQTVTVQRYAGDTYAGVCDVAKVWTTGGYLKPGLVTRAVVFINTNCNVAGVQDRTALTAKALGKPIGLAERPTGMRLPDSTVMSAAWLPTTLDYSLVEQTYPW